MSGVDIWQEINFDESLVGQMHETAHSQAKDIEKSTHRPSGKMPSQIDAGSGISTAMMESTAKSDNCLEHILTATVKKYGGAKNFSSFMKSKFTLYLRDAGGQVEFQEMVSLLVFGPSIFLFVFKADQDLDSKFTVGYRKSEGEVLNCYESSITIEDALLQCLASVYAMGSFSEAGIKTHNPYVLIVATHKDLLGPSADEKIDKLNRHLHRIITVNGFEDLVQYANANGNHVMFTVDNTAESDDDFKPIRKKVHDLVCGRSEFNIEYSISYLFFCLELQSNKLTTFTLEECQDMAAKYEIVGDQVFKLLNFLHLRIGAIYFINIDGVKPRILKKPEYLFNNVTDVIVKTFSRDSFTTKEFMEFEKKGILTESAFESVISSRDSITPKEFIKFLIHLHIIAKLPTPGSCEVERYFMPCTLNHVAEAALKYQRKSDLWPLAIKFKRSHCPRGLFGVLITHLMDDRNFRLNEEEIYKDEVFFIVLSRGVQDKISLKAYFSHLEIKFFPEVGPKRLTALNDVCNMVRQQIENLLCKSVEVLHYNLKNVEPEICLRCMHCHDLHPVDTASGVLHCTESHSRIHIPEEGQCWFSELDYRFFAIFIILF